jgi:isocitrate dehydrogenase
VEEGHLRWDSLGEFLAIAVSLEDLANKTQNPKAQVLADTLNQAIGVFLDENKSPSRKVNELDNRGSHFYLTLFWAEALASQSGDKDLQNRFGPFAEKLRSQEEAIVAELNDAQGTAIDLGGYYLPDPEKASQAMRPSPLFNDAIDSLS